MAITRVVGKGRTAVLTPDAFAAVRARFPDVAVDVGTGDGRYAYHLATADPGRLVIGLDALAEHMGERAATASRKPARGGRPNLLFVHSAIEALPAELEHVADEVYVQLPWGRLLEGIVLAHGEVLGGIAALCRPGARVIVTLNGEIWLDSTPARYKRDTRPCRKRRGFRPAGRASSVTDASIRRSFSSKARRWPVDPVRRSRAGRSWRRSRLRLGGRA
jgi:hypothetical protein